MTFFFSARSCPLTRVGDGVGESGSYAPIKQAISRCPGRPKGGPAEVIPPPGVRGDSRDAKGKKGTESKREHRILLSDHRACIALTGVISPFCTPTWTRACAHILLCTIRTERESGDVRNAYALRGGLPFNGVSLCRRRNAGLKRLHSRKVK